MKYLILLLLTFWSWALFAQDCSSIRQKVKTAVNSRLLDEALVQVKALRACDNSAIGKKEADDWTERIFLLLKERQAQAKAAELKAQAEAAQAQRDAELAETARQQAELERNNALAAQQLAAQKSQEKDLAEEERILALQKKAQLIRIADLQHLGRNKIEERDYPSAISYFNQAQSLLNQLSPRSTTFATDSASIQRDIAYVEKILAMQAAIKRLYHNLDSAAQWGQSDFPGAFQELRMAMARPLSSIKEGLSYRADSLGFVQQLEQLLFQTRLRVREYRVNFLAPLRNMQSLESQLQIEVAAAELDFFLGRPQLAQRRLGSLLPYQQHTARLMQYTMEPFLQNRIAVLGGSFWNKWEIGLGVKSYSGIGINKTFVKFPNGESVKLKKSSALFGYFPFELNIAFYFDDKRSISFYNRFSRNNYNNQQVDAKKNDYFDEFNEDDGGEKVGRELSLVYFQEIYSLISREARTKLLSIQFCAGITVGRTDDGFSYIPGFNSYLRYEENRPGFWKDSTLIEFNEIILFNELQVQLNDLNQTALHFYPVMNYIRYDAKRFYLNVPFGLKVAAFPFFKYRLGFSCTIAYNLPLVGNSYVNPSAEIRSRNIIPPAYQELYAAYLADRIDVKYNFSKINQIFSAGLSLSLGMSFRL